jgi:hypothetical protein
MLCITRCLLDNAGGDGTYNQIFTESMHSSNTPVQIKHSISHDLHCKQSHGRTTQLMEQWRESKRAECQAIEAVEAARTDHAVNVR